MGLPSNMYNDPSVSTAAMKVAPAAILLFERVNRLAELADSIEVEANRIDSELTSIGIVPARPATPGSISDAAAPYTPTLLERLEWLEQTLHRINNKVNYSAVELSVHSGNTIR